MEQTVPRTGTKSALQWVKVKKWVTVYDIVGVWLILRVNASSRLPCVRIGEISPRQPYVFLVDSFSSRNLGELLQKRAKSPVYVVYCTEWLFHVRFARIWCTAADDSKMSQRAHEYIHTYHGKYEYTTAQYSKAIRKASFKVLEKEMVLVKKREKKWPE